MVGIAAVLLLIVIAFSIAVVVSNPTVLSLSIFGAQVPVTLGGVYLTGAGAMLVLILAAALLRTGLRRRGAQRRQLRALEEAAGSRAGEAAPYPTDTGTIRTGSRTSEAAPSPMDSATIRTGSSAVPTSASASSAVPIAPAAATGPVDKAPAPAAVEAETTAAERQALLDEAEELTGEREDR